MAMTGAEDSRSLNEAQQSALELCAEDLYSGLRGCLVPHFSVLGPCGLGLQQLQHAASRALRLSRSVETRESSSGEAEVLREAGDGGDPPSKRRRISGNDRDLAQRHLDEVPRDTAVSIHVLLPTKLQACLQLGRRVST